MPNKSDHIISSLNALGKEKVPFLFVFDFLCEKPIIIKLKEIDNKAVMYSVNGITNAQSYDFGNRPLSFDVEVVGKSRYRKAFDIVQRHIRHGDSFLLNLTFPSPIESNFGLKDIFYASKAKYKLWVKDGFVVFSPEIFVRTKNNIISSFPMKGTIDADVPEAEEKLLSSEKELAEHYTIVDLIRNDLSIVSKNVRVERFRYLEKIKTNRGNLLQMSSKVSGDLTVGWQENLGGILMRLLPAGSISGAPKKKTIEIIKKTEKYDRGYYTGVFGIFDGENIDSGVMIRFVEKTDSGLIYKSGGGITARSDPEEEYDELLQKVYVPL
ncbi:MAG: aminodeoxychorismate synthase component I [Chlorobi bacterium]|nr:aminodeoxychorismate synthase component I [Chlorobiota bacterium]